MKQLPKCSLTKPTAWADTTSPDPTRIEKDPSSSCVQDSVHCIEEQTWLVAPESTIQGEESSSTIHDSRTSKSHLLFAFFLAFGFLGFGLTLSLPRKPLPLLWSRRRWFSNICLTGIIFVVLHYGLKDSEFIKQLSQTEPQLIDPIVAFKLIETLWKSHQYDAHLIGFINGLAIDLCRVEVGHHVQDMFPN